MSIPVSDSYFNKIGTREIKSFTIKKPSSVSIKSQPAKQYSSEVICLSGAQEIVCEKGAIKITWADMLTLNSEESDSTVTV